MEKEEVWDVLLKFHNEVVMPDFRRALDERMASAFDPIEKALDVLEAKIDALRDALRA